MAKSFMFQRNMFVWVDESVADRRENLDIR